MNYILDTVSHTCTQSYTYLHLLHSTPCTTLHSAQQAHVCLVFLPCVSCPVVATKQFTDGYVVLPGMVDPPLVATALRAINCSLGRNVPNREQM